MQTGCKTFAIYIYMSGKTDSAPHNTLLWCQTAYVTDELRVITVHTSAVRNSTLNALLFSLGEAETWN